MLLALLTLQLTILIDLVFLPTLPLRLTLAATNMET